MEWVRGETIGRGSFGKVDLAVSKSGTSPTAVKSAPVYNSQTLRHERDVLALFSDSDNVIRCFGESYGLEKGERVYNVFLEYAEKGSVYDRVKRSGGGLDVEEVRSVTRSVLKGLKDVHLKGYVHCDVKLQNILLCSDSSENDSVVAKIADFGLARKQSDVVNEFYLYGTPLYMAPETVTKGEFDAPADIWAVGCAVVEMLTGISVWMNESNIAALFLKIAEQSPELPANLNSEVRDFLENCFVRNAAERWTAKMLLDHEFLATELSKKETISPRCPFDFPEFVTPSPISQSGFGSWIEKDKDCEIFDSENSSANSLAEGLRLLVSDQIPNWVFSDSWVVVR